jgi:hypothetical protein
VATAAAAVGSVVTLSPWVSTVHAWVAPVTSRTHACSSGRRVGVDAAVRHVRVVRMSPTPEQQGDESSRGIDVSFDPRLFKVRLSRATGIEYVAHKHFHRVKPGRTVWVRKVSFRLTVLNAWFADGGPI